VARFDLEDAKALNQMYAEAAEAIPTNMTAQIRVLLTQQIIDEWGGSGG
jgi:hypothetical protein